MYPLSRYSGLRAAYAVLGWAGGPWVGVSVAGAVVLGWAGGPVAVCLGAERNLNSGVVGIALFVLGWYNLSMVEALRPDRPTQEHDHEQPDNQSRDQPI